MESPALSSAICACVCTSVADYCQSCFYPQPTVKLLSVSDSEKGFHANLTCFLVTFPNLPIPFCILLIVCCLIFPLFYAHPFLSFSISPHLSQPHTCPPPLLFVSSSPSTSTVVLLIANQAASKPTGTSPSPLPLPPPLHALFLTPLSKIFSRDSHSPTRTHISVSSSLSFQPSARNPQAIICLLKPLPLFLPFCLFCRRTVTSTSL